MTKEKMNQRGWMYLMISSNVKRLPIVQDNKLVGIIAMTDVLAHHEGGFDEEFILN